MADIQSVTGLSCQNCGRVLHGQYCSGCGQKHLGKRLDAVGLVSNAFAALTEFDSAIWRTVRECTRNAGQVALNYINGQRSRYVNPVKFFLTVFALYVALLAATGTLDRIADDSVQFGEGTDMESVPAQAALAFQGILRTHFNLIFFTTLPLFALMIRWQYWRAGRNYAETLSFLCFVVGISCVYSSVFVVGLPILDIYSNLPRAIILTIVFAIGTRTFFLSQLVQDCCGAPFVGPFLSAGDIGIRDWPDGVEAGRGVLESLI
jgi:hypothetical protein